MHLTGLTFCDIDKEVNHGIVNAQVGSTCAVAECDLMENLDAADHL